MRLTINSSYAVFTPKQNETDVEFKFNNIETDGMDEGKKNNGGDDDGPSQMHFDHESSDEEVGLENLNITFDEGFDDEGNTQKYISTHNLPTCGYKKMFLFMICGFCVCI